MTDQYSNKRMKMDKGQDPSFWNAAINMITSGDDHRPGMMEDGFAGRITEKDKKTPPWNWRKPKMAYGGFAQENKPTGPMPAKPMAGTMQSLPWMNNHPGVDRMASNLAKAAVGQPWENATFTGEGVQGWGTTAPETAPTQPVNIMQVAPISRPAPQGYARGGFVNHASGGRADTIDMSVNDGSYVVPADILSALGAGNSLAGAEIMNKMLGKEPQTQAQGGGDVDLSISGGEYVIAPESVAQIGQGDINHGHEILDQFIKQVRQKNVKTLQNLPGPVK